METRTKEAVERLRRCYEGSESVDVIYGQFADGDYTADDAAEIDEQVVSRLWFAEHPADDDEPVTVEWLASKLVPSSLSPAVYGYSKSFGQGCSLRLVIYETGQVEIHCLDGSFITIRRVKTRGDVRRLCAALGIELDKQPVS